MQKRLIVRGSAAAVAALLLWAWPRYVLVGLLAALAGWVGRALYAKCVAR